MSNRAGLSSANPDRIEAPVTLKSYLMCAFSAFGGIFFGYDSGYINGVMGMPYFIRQIEGPDATSLGGFSKAIITSVLSLGTFIGALVAGDFADLCGRRTTVLGSCAAFLIGVVLQVASAGLPLLVVGRAIAGLGVGGRLAKSAEPLCRAINSVLLSYCLDPIVPKGLLLASAIDYATRNRADSSSYRIPIAIQMVWALVLAGGLSFLPESPRFYVRRGELDRAAYSLSRLRDQPVKSEFVKTELAEIITNYEHEHSLVPPGGYWSTWLACGRGSLRKGSSHLRRTALGTSLQMMQQWFARYRNILYLEGYVNKSTSRTGVNFIFYFGTTLEQFKVGVKRCAWNMIIQPDDCRKGNSFQDLGTIQDPFQISLITTLVNVFSTPISFWAIEKLGRRPLFLWGAFGMTICQFIIAIIGTVAHSTAALSAMITFICVFIAFFASTWGPGAWVLVGEIFPLPIRARGIALSTASNWLWNFIIGLITPYMVDKDKGNLGAKVFYIWGSLCATAFFFTWFLIPETKGLTLEQVDRMLEETTPRTSSKWKPHDVYTAEAGSEDGPVAKAPNGNVDDGDDDKHAEKTLEPPFFRAL
ncbi:hypothetical protein RRF57_002870 [Xylaria bambusicola]|uniref:Major facilitator superfamily (MFS) profile domain-containing protein n=1 Tax=Xylaria bambusicola TaxID=326684 RepID=A0AAN7YVZ5_9PEZI